MNRLYKLFTTYPQIELDNYVLRNLSESDYKDIYEIYSDIETLKYEGMEPLKTEEVAHQYIEKLLMGYKNKYFIRWVIESKENKKVIGLIALHHIDYQNFSSQIGYILNKNYWHKNIMSIVLTEWINFIYNNTEIHRLEACIHPQNQASIRLAEKLGFKSEGLKKQSAYNQLTKSFEDQLMMALII